MQLHLETVPKSTSEVLKKISGLDSLIKFYLSGGTALTLQLGHRESEDLDFFTKHTFSPLLLQQELIKHGDMDNVIMEEGTLNTFMNGVKLQFLYYPYELLEEPIKWNGLSLSSTLDIACTKLITISMRGSKKDFIDMYAILHIISLDNLFHKLDNKYRQIDYNKPHILKSLIYFDDAEAQPMPRMHIPLEWTTVKEFMVNEAKKIVF